MYGILINKYPKERSGGAQNYPRKRKVKKQLEKIYTIKIKPRQSIIPQVYRDRVKKLVKKAKKHWKKFCDLFDYYQRNNNTGVSNSWEERKKQKYER